MTGLQSIFATSFFQLLGINNSLIPLKSNYQPYHVELKRNISFKII